jgi:hypothetical protein
MQALGVRPVPGSGCQLPSSIFPLRKVRAPLDFLYENTIHRTFVLSECLPAVLLLLGVFCGDFLPFMEPPRVSCPVLKPLSLLVIAHLGIRIFPQNVCARAGTRVPSDLGLICVICVCGVCVCKNICVYTCAQNVCVRTGTSLGLDRKGLSSERSKLRLGAISLSLSLSVNTYMYIYIHAGTRVTSDLGVICVFVCVCVNTYMYTYVPARAILHNVR